MTRRTVLIASDEAAHRAWIAAATAAAFHTPTWFPTLRRPKEAPELEERLPDLFPETLEALAEPEVPVGTPVDVLLRAHFGDVLPGASPLTLRRRELKRQREAAATAAVEEPAQVAEEPVPIPVAEPDLKLTFDMGRFRDAHMLDRCEPAERGYVVASPPFHLHDEDEVDPVDEFLGQVVGIEAGRALLFRRRDPGVMDGCDLGGRYILIRFWDDEGGQVWSMPIEGEEDAAVLEAIQTVVGLYLRGRQRAA